MEVLGEIPEFLKIIRDDPRIGVALVVLVAAGAIVAVLIRRFRGHDDRSFTIMR